MKNFRHRTRAGFTLVELMIALLLTGVVSVVIYSLFDTTSDNFIEVDNLADATDRVRFAMERVRSDVQMAGSQMSPDSDNDTAWVQPAPSAYRVAGIVPYTDWQGDSTNDPRPADVQTANATTSFDGFILMGAFDFPLSFEISGLLPDQAAGNNEAAIVAHHRGLYRLHSANPFATSMTSAMDFRTAATAAPVINSIFEGAAARLIRISDRQGYHQYVRIVKAPTSADFVPASASNDWPNMRLRLPAPNSTLGPQFKRTSAGVDGEFGLDNAPEGDIGYDAAFIDAFWYHVIPHPTDPNIMRLVRDRLCAPEVAVAFSGGAIADPSTLIADATNCPNLSGAGFTVAAERIVIADNVADFQIWTDCADAQGAMSGDASQVWSTGWDAPAGDSGGGCMNTAAPEPGRARVAHLRLTLHTPTERKSQANIQFEDRTGALCNPDPTVACDITGLPDGAMLRTYDPYPTVTGAARVVTMQADVALPNFSYHNVL